MKKMLSVLICIVVMVSGSCYACTAIRIKANDGAIVAARTMEFGLDVHNSIALVPRNLAFAAQLPDGSAGMKWTNKYGYAAIDAFGDYRTVMDGMNEKGLAFSALWYETGTQYQAFSSSEKNKALPYTMLGGWILGNFGSASEAAAALQKARVFGVALPGFANSLPLHFILTDAGGGCIVAEYDKGELNVYDNPLGIMTNAPNFPWQLNNLRLYAGLTNASENSIDFGNMHQNTIGHGGGFLGLPGDYTPPSRFAKMAVLTHFAKPVKDAGAAVNLAHHIINTVDISDGSIVDRDAQGKEIASETTQWTVIRDLTGKVMYYYTYDNMSLRAIDFSKIDFSAKAPKNISLAGGENHVEDMTAAAR